MDGCGLWYKKFMVFFSKCYFSHFTGGVPSLTATIPFLCSFPAVAICLSMMQGGNALQGNGTMAPLCTGQIVSLLIAGLVGSIGLSSVPKNGILTLIIALQTGGVPITGLIGLFIFLDIFLARLRLAGNTCGDIFACRITDMHAPGTLSVEQQTALSLITQQVLRLSSGRPKSGLPTVNEST